jgi:hypothetical protein
MNVSPRRIVPWWRQSEPNQACDRVARWKEVKRDYVLCSCKVPQHRFGTVLYKKGQCSVVSYVISSAQILTGCGMSLTSKDKSIVSDCCCFRRVFETLPECFFSGHDIDARGQRSSTIACLLRLGILHDQPGAQARARWHLVPLLPHHSAAYDWSEYLGASGALLDCMCYRLIVFPTP